MYSVVVIILEAVVVAAALILDAVSTRLRPALWRQAARQVGLENVHEDAASFTALGELSGCAGDLGVRLSHSHSTRGTRIVVRGDDQIAASVWMWSGVGAPHVTRLSGSADPDLGGPHTDRGAQTMAAELVALLPLLDGETRSAIARVAGFRGRITSGAVEVEVADRAGREWRVLGIKVALNVVRSLPRPEDAVARMAAIARSHPSPELRRHYLTCLARQHPRHAQAREVLCEALQSTDARTRVETALALGAELTRVLVQTTSIANPLAEPSFVAALTSEDADMRIFAAETLDRIGTAAAIAPLRAAMLNSAARIVFQSTAAKAIAAIQARLPGASPGQVSLAEGESGQVSLASDAEAGQVALAPEGSDAP